MVCYEEIVEAIYDRGFHVIDEFLPIEHVRGLRQYAHHLMAGNQFQAAKIGSQQNASTNQTIRRDKIYWLDESNENPNIQAYFTAMKAISTAFNQQLFLGLVDFETHFALYQPDSFYKKHIDQFSNKQERRISCVYYLNEEWQMSFGGQLTLYDKNDEILTSILPTSNRLVCFISDLPHEVSKTTQTRLSIAGWMKTRALASIA
jgi:SM-20-related protein